MNLGLSAIACGNRHGWWHSRRDNVTADAAGRIRIFPLDLPEWLHDAADSG
jgi:hypothetical protein